MSVRQRNSRIEAIDDAMSTISDGMMIAIGEPPPMAAIRNLLRRRLTQLTVIASGFALDVLIAGGCVAKAISYYAGGGFGVPVVPSFRRAAESGEIEVWECDEGILTSGLEAAAKGLPYLPWRGGVGTSIPEVNRDLLPIVDPIGGESLLAVPALCPDVALLHAAYADPFGNVRHCDGPGWLDLFLARAARRTIVQVEQVISNEEVRAHPWSTTIAGADAVLRMPYGAHPFYSRGHYVQDVDFLNRYFRVANNGGVALAAFLDRYFREPRSHPDYLERIGIKRLLALHEF